MCGRFQLSVKGKEITERFNTELFDERYKPSFNCAPGQLLPVITEQQPHKLSLMRWGLVPSWARDLNAGMKNFNCRAETIHEKASFRMPFRRQRCLVPANGYYEWKQDASKQAYRFFLKGEAVFAMAGIWDSWTTADGGLLHSFSVITTQANTLTLPIHHRMPVILPLEAETRWLYTTEYQKLTELLKPYPAEAMGCYPVSARVNNVANNDEKLAEAVRKQNDLFEA